MSNYNLTSASSHAPATDIPVIQRLYDFYKLFHQYLIKYPKGDRYTLGHDIETSLLELIEILYSCSAANPITKKERLIKVSAKLDLLKLLVRLSYELKALDQKAYILLQEKLQDIGKMIGGWLRSLA